MSFWTAAINGVIAVPLLVPVVTMGSSREVVGERAGGGFSRTLTWTATALMGRPRPPFIVTLLPLPGIRT